MSREEQTQRALEKQKGGRGSAEPGSGTGWGPGASPAERSRARLLLRGEGPVAAEEAFTAKEGNRKSCNPAVFRIQIFYHFG